MPGSAYGLVRRLCLIANCRISGGKGGGKGKAVGKSSGANAAVLSSLNRHSSSSTTGIKFKRRVILGNSDQVFIKISFVVHGGNVKAKIANFGLSSLGDTYNPSYLRVLSVQTFVEEGCFMSARRERRRH